MKKKGKDILNESGKLAMGGERRSEQKVIGTYMDPKHHVQVKVLAGPVDVPYRHVPVGYED